MQIIDRMDFELDGEYAVAVGKFDGIHKGHQKLIDEILSNRANGIKSAVFTFDPSPAVFFGKCVYKGLTTRDEKRYIFEKLGVDVLVEYPLNQESASIAPEKYVEDILVKKMHAKVVVCGPDWTFGDKGRGNVALLEELGQRFDFEVKICEKVKANNNEMEISSTLIRNEVMAGQMEKVTEHIGAYYSVTGVVTKGKQIGRTIGLPTVNIIPHEDKLLPPNGVYEALVSIGGKRYKGITNVGVKPTVTDEKSVVIETHIFDFNQNVYGETITVNLLKMVRPEQKFASVEELKAQIERDIIYIRNN